MSNKKRRPQRKPPAHELDGYGVDIEDERGSTALELRAGRDLNLPLPDSNVSRMAGYNVELPPDFVLSPEGDGTRWYIKQHNITVHNLPCQHCQDEADKVGVIVDDNKGKDVALVLCAGCEAYNVVELRKRGVVNG